MLLQLHQSLWFFLLQDVLQQQPTGNCEKQRLINLQDLEMAQHTWGHTVRSLRERGHTGPALLFLGSRQGGLGWCRLSLLVNLKHRGGNLKWSREADQGTKWSVPQINKIAKTKDPGWGTSSALHLALQLAMCLFQRLSLKLMPL